MSVKKPIKIYARLKPQSSDIWPYEIQPVENDESNDDILVINTKNLPDTSLGPGDAFVTQKGVESHRFRFSKVFEQTITQSNVFEVICKPVLDSALNGYNGTVFAYGQTGSGKTYTMTGSKTVWDQRGIIPRALSYVFEQFQGGLNEIAQLQGVSVSYLEIYNDSGYDLLHSALTTGKLEQLSKVELMEDSKRQIHLKHLSVNPVASAEEAAQLFYLGEHNRTIAETPMNEASTRSHCIFTIYLNIRESEESLVRRSKVHLVDLAGSERISNSNITGQLFNEARHINLALHYLEQVIVALGESNRSHIPYRNSMMTSILRDSLGGNCMTSMIATLSLEMRNITETLSTCRFSQRVALVTNDAVMNEEMDPDALIAQLKAEIKRLKETIANTTVKPLAEDPTPLSPNELSACWEAVQKYMSDPDDQATLAVTPDMRLIQACFRCFKMACNIAKTKKGINLAKFTLPDCEAYPQNKKIQELLTTLNHRDLEIKTLVKALKSCKEENAKLKFTLQGPATQGVASLPSSPKQDALYPLSDSIRETKSFPNPLVLAQKSISNQTSDKLVKHSVHSEGPAGPPTTPLGSSSTNLVTYKTPRDLLNLDMKSSEYYLTAKTSTVKSKAKKDASEKANLLTSISLPDAKSHSNSMSKNKSKCHSHGDATEVDLKHTTKNSNSSPEFIQNVPITGDPDTDKEIMEFVKKRRAVYEQMKVHEAKIGLDSTSPNAIKETSKA